MIRRVTVRGYKSFHHLNLALQPLTVVFGPNASGKSNLLDALYLISRTATQRNLKEAFEGHRGLPLETFHYGDEGFDALLQRERVTLEFEIDVQLSESTIQQVERIVQEKRMGLDSVPQAKRVITERLLRYRLAIASPPKTGYLQVVDERLSAIKTNGEDKKRTPFIEVGTDKRVHLRMEGQAHPLYFDLGMDHTVVSTALYEPHYPHITAFRTELANWHTYYLEPRDLMRETVPIADVEVLGSRGANLAAFLNSLQTRYQRDFDAFNKALRQMLPTDPEVRVRQTPEGLVGLELRENGIWYSARLVSEGTLRLLGLLAALHPRAPSTVVAFEEPENGVHPVRLRTIGDLLKNTAEGQGKQVIVTTHSPLLPESFDYESLYVCSKQRNRSVIKPLSDHGPLFKQQLIDTGLEDRIVRGDFGG